MKLWLILSCVILLILASDSLNYGDMADNEFAEFEDFESEEEIFTAVNEQTEEESQRNSPSATITKDAEQDDVIIEDESEFEHFQDSEEFEGFAENKDEKPATEPKITITKVPIHFRANWDSYWLEILMVTGLIVYFINFATGKNKNTKLANVWFQTHRNLLEENFSLIGDDSTVENKEADCLIKESENVFTLWCSGRICCEGMLVEIKLIKRQDLIAILAGIMRPTLDQIHIKVIMNKEDMDNFVFCVASKKTALHMSKEMADINMYCPERRSGEKHNIPSSFFIMNEISESTSAMLDSKITTVLNKYVDYIDYMHFSDQFTGVKQSEDNGVYKLPEAQKVLLFGFNVPVKGLSAVEAMEQLKPLMIMVFYCIDKIRKYRLSKEGKMKADKNRQRVEEAFLKSTHVARAEAAAARREERKRLEKEKIMADADPEKQRRWEEKNKKTGEKKSTKDEAIKS